jgi:hypothetical protein
MMLLFVIGITKAWTLYLDLLYLNEQMFKFVINILFLYYFNYFSTSVHYIF